MKADAIKPPAARAMSGLDITQQRIKLLLAGFLPIPVKGKHPPMGGWQAKTEVSPDEIRSWGTLYNSAPSTGLLTQRMPTLDIDILNNEAAEAVEALLREHYGQRGLIAARIGLAPKRAIPFRTETPFPKITANVLARDGKPGQKLEFLGNGQQVVAFGIHPDTAKPYQWHGGIPGDFKLEALPSISEAEAKDLIAAAVALLCDEHGFQRAPASPAGSDGGGSPDDWAYLFASINTGGGYHDPLRDLACKMIVGGVGGGIATNMLRGLMDASPAPHDERWQERYDDIPRAVRTAEAKFGGKAEAAANVLSTLFDPWQPFVVPAFPLDVLPAGVQDFVCTQSDIIGCDLSMMGMISLANFSAALDHRFELKMMKHGDWMVRAALWLLLFGKPSVKKSPAIKAGLKELDSIQNLLREAYQTALKASKEADSDPPPPPARYITNDPTTDKLADILARNPHGLLLERDELSGWIGQMDRYGGAKRNASGDRPFWLKAYDGGGWLVDRIGRGEIYVPNLSVSIIGGIQPRRLAELNDLTTDGLLQRFLPVMVRESVFTKDQPTAGPFDAYAVLTRKLLRAEPQRLVLENDALQCMEDLRRHLHDLEQEAEGFAEGFPGFVGKLAGVAGSLSLILHMAARPDDGGLFPVDLDTVAKVSRLMLEFILPHGFEFYRTVEATTDGDRLQRIASYILTSGKDRLVASDLTSNVAGLRGLSVFDLNRRVSPLVAGGWLIPAEKEIINRTWTVAPGVRERFMAKAAEEQRRKERLAELMGSRRRAS